MASETSDYERQQAIFGAAVELKSREERDAYIEAACGEDARLMESLKALVKAYEEGDETLTISDESAGDSGSAGGLPSEGEGTIIGRYKLIQKIGEGGFGVVWVAEQT